MNRRTKRLLLLATAVLLIGCALAGWTTARIVAWVRDLPNRIVIDGDAAVAAVRTAVIESYHDALEEGDTRLRLQVINEQFVPMIEGHPEAATWIRNEYRNDILALVDSADEAVSAAASDLIARLDADTESSNR